MFSAALLLIDGKTLHGIVLMLVIAFFSASYIILTRNGSRYPTNLCIAGCILCAIATDVIWSLFVNSNRPIFGVVGNPGQNELLFYEITAAGFVFFCGLIVTNIVKVRKFFKLKIALLALFVVISALLAINAVTVSFIDRIPLFGLSLFATNVILIILECVDVIAIGVLAIAGRGEKSTVNTVTALILCALTVTAAVIGIVRCAPAHEGEEPTAESETVFVTEEYDLH